MKQRAKATRGKRGVRRAPAPAETLEALKEKLEALIRKGQEPEAPDGPQDQAELAEKNGRTDADACLGRKFTQELRDVQAALYRVDAGEYGICLECRKVVAAKRLRAYPAAALCIGCQERADAATANRRPASMRRRAH